MFGAMFQMLAERLEALVPERSCVAVVLPNEDVVPHSNHAVVSAPFGFTDPLSTAAVCVMPDALEVVTEGADASVPPVVNESVAP